MPLSSRTKKIVSLLASRRDFITMDELANTMELSQRTVYREMPAVMQTLQEFGIKLENANKRGVRAVGTSEQFKRLKSYLGEEEETYLVDAGERSDYILLYLVRQDDFIKMRTIAYDNRYAFSTVRTDLDKARQRLAGYKLDLVQRKGQGVRLDGSHMEKDRLTTDILLKRVEETTFFRWLNQGEISRDPYLSWIEGHGLRDPMVFAHQCLRQVVSNERGPLASIRTRDYLEMVILFALLLSCHGSSEQYEADMGAKSDSPAAESVHRELVALFNEHLEMPLSKHEASYVKWVIQICFGRIGAAPSPDQSLDKGILRFVEYVESRMGVYLARDKELWEGLYVHLDRALVRIRCNMQIENPALAEIKENHAELFRIVREGVRSCFKGDYFPDDEIGYLVLYFAIALDKFTKRIFRVIVVCSGGMGSSRMLASALEREIPEIKVEKTLSVVALGNENLSDYDLVLSTIPLYLDDDAYLRVSPMPTDKDLDQVKDKIRRHKHGQLRRIGEEERRKQLFQNENSAALLVKAQAISAMGLCMLEGFGYHPLSRRASVEEAVQAALESHFSTTDSRVPVTIKRASEFLLPLSSTIFFEGQSPMLSHPTVFALLDTEAEGSAEAEASEADSAIAVLYPDTLESSERRALLFLIEQIIQDSSFIECLASDRSGESTEAVKNWIGYRLREYLGQLITE